MLEDLLGCLCGGVEENKKDSDNRMAEEKNLSNIQEEKLRGFGNCLVVGIKCEDGT